MREDGEKSFGEMETLRTPGEERGEEALSMGEAETLKESPSMRGAEARSMGEEATLAGEGWGILEEWGGKRWTAGEEILGRYVVERELGQGGMGVVYACQDKVGGVRVAVKALPPELSHNSVEMEEVRENFELVVGLRHPNIAGVRTLEKDGKGEYFLVMDVAEGVSLRKWLREKGRETGDGRRGVPEAVGVLRQVASALDYAHGEKVIHRDVKPGNVMIDGQGRVKVLDFGLAAQIRTSLSRASQAYRGTSGTGPYMAPEQWRAEPQDARTDQYALAVVAYEMLAGRLPFENGEIAVLREAVLREEPKAIPGLSKVTMAALRRGMAKEAGERFGSCGEFVEALGGMGGRRNARGKTLMGWAAVLVLLAGAGGGVWWWGGKDAGEASSVPVAADDTPASRQEGTRLEAASPEEEAERKAEEEKRLAEQKAAEEEAARLEEERVKAEREEAIRQESEELEETVYRLAPLARTKAANAEGMGYDRGQGFGERLDEAKSKLEQGEAAMQGRNFGKAKAWFEESMAAAAWCEENAPLRKAAANARDAAGTKKRAAEAMDGAHLGLTAWNRAEKARKTAAADFAAARFKEATAGWNTAGTAYGESEKAARAEKVKQGLEAARGAKGREAWEECLKEVEGVLALESSNMEAQELKAAAEGNLKPSIRVTATLDGREVKARVTELTATLNGREMKTRMKVTGGKADSEAIMTPVKANLERGGIYNFTLEYEEGEKKYAGRTTVTAKEWGVTPATVALEEVKEWVAGATTKVDLGGGVVLEMVACPVVGEDFWMGKYEVTQEQWERVMGTKPSYFNNRPKNPVESVSWDKCQEFIEILNERSEVKASGLTFRLPTEEEWETACRAGAPKGADYCKLADGTQITEKTLSRVAYFGHNWEDGPTSVGGGREPNAWGLYDMHGNVWEWTSTAVGVRRVHRGGSFGGGTAGFWAAGTRAVLDPDCASRDLGLRLAASGRVATR